MGRCSNSERGVSAPFELFSYGAGDGGSRGPLPLERGSQFIPLLSRCTRGVTLVQKHDPT